MKNWLGQDIRPTDKVWRGARSGNTSSFKVGEVLRVNPEKGTATVEWLIEPGGYHFGNAQVLLNFPRLTESKGSPSIHSLVKIDNYDFSVAKQKAEQIMQAIKDGAPYEVVKALI